MAENPTATKLSLEEETKNLTELNCRTLSDLAAQLIKEYPLIGSYAPTITAELRAIKDALEIEPLAFASTSITYSAASLAQIKRLFLSGEYKKLLKEKPEE